MSDTTASSKKSNRRSGRAGVGRRGIAWVLAAGLVAVIGMTAVAPSAGALVHPTKVLPKYKIEALKFYAADESGWDGAWYAPVSDEPYFVFSSVGADGTSTSRRTQVYSDVDSGETRTMTGTDRCVFRTDCTGATAPSGIGVSIQLWESDNGSASNTLSKTAEYFKKAGDIADYVSAPAWVSKAAGYVASACNVVAGWLRDDLLGTRTLTYSPAWLAKYLPSVGRSVTETRYFGGLGSSDGADYYLTLRVSRVG